MELILASEALKKATALEEEKVLQETEEMSQEIATLIEEAVSRGETRVAFLSHKKRLTKSIDNIGKILKKAGIFIKSTVRSRPVYLFRLILAGNL